MVGGFLCRSINLGQMSSILLPVTAGELTQTARGLACFTVFDFTTLLPLACCFTLGQGQRSEVAELGNGPKSVSVMLVPALQGPELSVPTCVKMIASRPRCQFKFKLIKIKNSVPQLHDVPRAQ